MDWASIAQGAGSLAGGIIGNAVNWKIAQENRGLQRETNAQNEALMREAWARDDTARQRMVKDLESAGLSKWLATGASPMTSSPISLTAPQNNYKADFSGMSDAFLHAYQGVNDIRRTIQETENAKETGKVIAHQVDEAEARARIAQHDADVFENRQDVASTDPAYLKYISEALNTIAGRNSTGAQVRSVLEGLGERADTTMNNVKNYFSKEAKAERKEKREVKKDEKYEARYGYERRKPLSMSDWAKANQIKLGSYQSAKLYDEYKQNFLRDAK